MNRKLKFLSIIAGALIIAFSCSKETVYNKKAEEVKNPQDDAMQAYNRIMNFKTKIAFYKENPAYKSGELISIDSLLWDFNAALNFDYSEVDDPYKNFYSQSVFPELTVDENNITVRDGADEIRDKIEERRHHFIDDEGVIVFYINPVEIILDKDDIDNNPLLDLTNGQGYDNERDYRIFYAHEDNCPTGTSLEDFECIEYDDMNFYLFEMEDLIYDIIPNEPTYWPEAEDYTFVRFNTIEGTMEQDNEEKYYLIHKPEIIFADRKTIER
jgi:hypothetical protein